MSYSQSHHINIEQWLKDNEGGSVAYLLSNGHLANIKNPNMSNGLVTGVDHHRADWQIPVGQIVAWAKMPAEEPEQSPEQLGRWQAAFIELRAACDASVDPAVIEAMAALEQIEEEVPS